MLAGHSANVSCPATREALSAKARIEKIFIVLLMLLQLKGE
jgi:hypothetical protein